MKKFLFLAAVAAAACTSKVPENECQVEINVEGLTDTVYVMVVNSEQTAYEKTDTIVAVDGKLTYTATLDEARIAILLSQDQSAQLQTYLLPGNKLVLTGTAEDYHMGGSEAYDQIEEYNCQGKDIKDKMQDLMKEYQTRMTSGEDAEAVQADIVPKYQALADELEQSMIEYLEAHPASLGSVLLLSQMGTEYFEKYDSVLTDDVKAGVLAPVYNKARARYEADQARLEAKKLLVEGAEAPDFTLTAIDGTELSLSSLRGKYVVIDFWGSWCGWCIKGMPEMKKYYEKYGAKLEILGVDCRDSEEAWKAAVEQHQLPWKHVRNGEGEQDITTTYAIEGYPTKLILDPDGKIVKYIVGEDPEFYTILDELLK